MAMSIWNSSLTAGVSIGRRFYMIISRAFAIKSNTNSFTALVSAAQLFVIVAASAIAELSYRNISIAPELSHISYVLPAVVLALIFNALTVLLNVQRIEIAVEHGFGFGSILGVLCLSFLVLIGVMYLAKTAEPYSRGWFLLWFSTSAVGLLSLRWYAVRQARALFRSSKFSRRFAIYGTPEYVSALKTRIESTVPFAQVTGLYTEEETPETSSNANRTLMELQQAVATGAYEKVFIALPETRIDSIRAAARALAPFNHELLLCMRLDPLPLPVHSSFAMGNLQALVLSPVSASERNHFLKRILDSSLALLGLLIFSPILILATISTKLDSPGPVFFRQRRYGRNNQIFRIYKFRTMHVAEDGAIVRQAQVGDSRITRVGRILRATSIDELPQLINVLLGQMSLVGPRPHALAHEEEFEQAFDLFSRRRCVLPGITGWAQVNGCRGETRTHEQIRKRMEYDLYYIDNWTIWFDIEILARTIITVSRGAV